MLDGRVLVHVADHTQGVELAHLIGACDRPAEHHDRRAMVELANGLKEHDPVALRDAKIDDDQVDPRDIGSNLCQQLLARLRRHGLVAGSLDRRLEPVAHECGIVGDQHGSPGEPSRGGHRNTIGNRAPQSLGFIAQILMSSL